MPKFDKDQIKQLKSLLGNESQSVAQPAGQALKSRINAKKVYNPKPSKTTDPRKSVAMAVRG